MVLNRAESSLAEPGHTDDPGVQAEVASGADEPITEETVMPRRGLFTPDQYCSHDSNAGQNMRWRAEFGVAFLCLHLRPVCIVC
ncbi:unnamed protein product [Protopolystoma xenopodis]|uniref:Uncharacterized protein n=1 Tax=Protopolystoma xenopodis TaxID=117903 RepID=A0A3S5AZH6_9PLAT|nr:unnamed protein product [Protopolystoma xenopodis]